VAVVCKQLRRRYIGFEIEHTQANIARRRLAETPITDMMPGFDQIPIGVLNRNDEETVEIENDLRPASDLLGGNGNW
jgi:hypothetical protein